MSIVRTPFSFTSVSTGSLAQQYAHPNATLHPHTPHPQPSATPTGQQQSQHGGSHPAPSPVQVRRHPGPCRSASSFCSLGVSAAEERAGYRLIKTPQSAASRRQQTANSAHCGPGVWFLLLLFLRHIKIHLENEVIG